MTHANVHVLRTETPGHDTREADFLGLFNPSSHGRELLGPALEVELFKEDGLANLVPMGFSISLSPVFNTYMLLACCSM